MKSRVKFAVKQLLKQGVIALILFIIFIVAGVWITKASFLVITRASILLMSNLYGMII